jgi:hypothetical protein
MVIREGSKMVREDGLRPQQIQMTAIPQQRPRIVNQPNHDTIANSSFFNGMPPPPGLNQSGPIQLKDFAFGYQFE